MPITEQEFGYFQRFIFEAAGITMSTAKKSLVSGRLAKRLRHHQLQTFSEYFALLTSGEHPQEVQTAVDLLTTNETYFFREPKHFALLRQQASAARGSRQPFRIWSAASSTGEEAYSIAMVLADCLDPHGVAWEVMGSDISARVLDDARSGHYSMARTTHIPKDYLQRFCLKGTGTQEGTLLIDKQLRARVRFSQVNLNNPLPSLGMFDLIFLRNVMIYFSADTKRQVVARVLSVLKLGGHFVIGHSETLHDISSDLEKIAPSVYRKA
jgi:chemotaxis protein methyltransferase CheR